MARQPSRTPATRAVAGRSSPGRLPFARIARGLIPLVPALGLALAAVPRPASAGVSLAPPRPGGSGASEPQTGSLLVDYYETFLREKDLEAFRQAVSARYTEASLGRLVESGSTEARRAAVLALGLIGSYEANGSVARALRDPDPIVRRLAGDGLWAIWFRADTPENNAMLEQVSGLIGQQRLSEAVDLATRLIGRAPRFAEAYNQRAIAHFSQGHFEESAADCHRVLERNPYHFGALSGLAQCQIRLGQRPEALKTLRRALRLQPHSEGLRQAVASLESEGN